MDNAVALVQAYLRVNGYFTVAEYPVVEAMRNGGYREATYWHSGFRALDSVCPEWPRRQAGFTSLRSHPALAIDRNCADMLIGEVKEGVAELNQAATDPAVLRAALTRFGCCPRDHIDHLVDSLLRDGRTNTPAGHTVLIVIKHLGLLGPLYALFRRRRPTTMTMTPLFRRFALTAHITFSVGWLGAVAAFLALSIAGLTSQDSEVVRGAYLAMNLIGLFIIVPISLAALATGLVQSLGTEWGLLRHYWVLVKLVLTILATILLLLHQFTAVAGAARRVSAAAPGTLPEVGQLGTQLVGDAGLALLVLLVITTLSVFKPWGRTLYGRRKQATTAVVDLPLGLRIFLTLIGVIMVGFVVLHLTGHAPGSHGR